MLDMPTAKALIREMDPILKDTDHEFTVAVIMLVMLEVGTYARAISHYTGYGLRAIQTILDRWKDNGVIGNGIDGNIYHSGWDKSGLEGAVAFWLDVGVGTGHFSKVYDDEQNQGTEHSVGQGLSGDVEARASVHADNPR